MNIPDKLKNDEFRFVLIAPKGKAPIEKKWTKGRTFDDPEVQQHKGNIGIIGGFGNLVIIDFDEATTMNALIPLLPNTFTVQTGGKGLLHLYFITDDPGSGRHLTRIKILYLMSRELAGK